jgi:hypothetical protein
MQITAEGTTELIEHRKIEPVFYITDDPAVGRTIGRLGVVNRTFGLSGFAAHGLLDPERSESP